MMTGWLERVRWQLSYWLDGVTHLQLLAAAALLLWAGLHSQVIMPLDAAWLTLQRESAALERPDQPHVQEAAAPSQSERLRQFLPMLAVREAQTAQLLRLAEHQGVQVERLDYRYEPVAGVGIGRQRLRLKVSGPYAAQRRFLHQALSAQSNLAIDQMLLEEREMTAADMTAVLDASLFYRAEVDVR